MKKILIIHNKYRELGGEDIAVSNEINLLKKHFEIETLFFDNEIKKYFKQIYFFLINKNLDSKKILERKIETFKPDLIYIHNTWFKASLSIFDVIDKKSIKTLLKLHNFRYKCTSTFLGRKHLEGENFCPACGMKKPRNFFNKYFEDSILKSFLSIRYGKKYLQILRKNKLQILVLTNFHKKYLFDKFGVEDSKVNVFNNFLEQNLEVKPNDKKSDYILYAGRISKEKGINNLIDTFISKDRQNLKLKIVGNGPELNNLENKFKHNKSIEFLGELSNDAVKALILKSLSVVTATKLFEGQPTFLCEASVMGIPSIYPKTEGITEFFPKNSNLAFNQFDYNDLSLKIDKVFDRNLLKNEGYRNKKFINNKLEEKHLIKKFKSIIHD